MKLNNGSCFTACGLVYDIVKWREITRNPKILEYITEYIAEFERKPFQRK